MAPLTFGIYLMHNVLKFGSDIPWPWYPSDITSTCIKTLVVILEPVPFFLALASLVKPPSLLSLPAAGIRASRELLSR
jgi:hypothetical protein